MKPTKDLMLNTIYSTIMYPDYNRWHTMRIWCCMIWDVLDWIRHKDLDLIRQYNWSDSRTKLVIIWDMEKYRMPIEDQSEECIEFIYNLIK